MLVSDMTQMLAWFLFLAFQKQIRPHYLTGLLPPPAAFSNKIASSRTASAPAMCTRRSLSKVSPSSHTHCIPITVCHLGHRGHQHFAGLLFPRRRCVLVPCREW